VGVCWGVLLWRQSLFHGSMSVVTCSCWRLWVVEVFKVLEGACPIVFEPFPCDWFVVCT